MKFYEVGPNLNMTQHAITIRPICFSGKTFKKLPPELQAAIVKAGSTLYIAGQVGADAQGKVVGPGMVEQLEQVLKNLQTALKSQGADFANVVRITIYTTDVDAFPHPDPATVRAKYFAKNLPASTLVGVARLASPDYKVEIEATAVLP